VTTYYIQCLTAIPEGVLSLKALLIPEHLSQTFRLERKATQNYSFVLIQA